MLCSGGGHEVGGKPHCGTTGYFYASAFDNDNYSVYGINTTQAIYSQTICGASAVVDFVTVYFSQTCFAPNGVLTYAELSIGYFQGAAAVTGQMVSSPHYYYDEFTPTGSGPYSACHYSFSDLSKSSFAPVVGSQVSFQMQALGTDSNKWSLSIVGDGHSISFTNIAAAQSHGWTAGATMESHDDKNTGTAQFSSLADFASPPRTCPSSWFPWSSSYTQRLPNDAANPYQVQQDSANSFNMWTGAT
jgi:hypothetical protein